MVADLPSPTMGVETKDKDEMTLNVIYEKQPATKQDVSILKYWLKKQKHLPAVSELELITFLTSCNNSLEATKSCIDAYFTIKSSTPELFGCRDPRDDKIMRISEVVSLSPLSKKSPEGYTYIFARLKDIDVNKYLPDVATKLVFMTMDAALRFEHTSPGIIVIYDMQGFTFQHLAKARPSVLKRYMMYIQDGMPVKLKTMHVINANPAINMIMTFLRPFMNKDHHDLIKFHSSDDMEKFHEFVAQKYMPKDYGGEDETVEELTRRNQNTLLNYRDWFIEDEDRCRVNEALREGKMSSCAAEQHFGQEGSFKKLSID